MMKKKSAGTLPKYQTRNKNKMIEWLALKMIPITDVL